MAATPTFDRALLEKYDRPGPCYSLYPGLPHLHKSFSASEYHQLAQASNEDPIPKPLAVGVHTPLCRPRRSGGSSHGTAIRRTVHASEYLDHLKREITLQAQLFDNDRQVEQLHLDDGVPACFTDEHLMALLDELARQFRIASSDDREFSLRVDPRSVTPERIVSLAALGFDRLSLDVQDLDPKVQDAIGRPLKDDQVADLVAAAHHAGFRSLNIDLVRGLPGQTLESFDATLDQAIALHPDRLTVHDHDPSDEASRTPCRSRAEDLPSREGRLELLELTLARLTTAGYVYIGQDHFALPDDELARARHTHRLQRNFQGYSARADCDLIGLGVTAIGKIGDSYSQNVRELSRYYTRLDTGQLPIWRGHDLSFDDLLRREVIDRLMCQEWLDFASIEARYRIVFRNYFAPELAALAPLADDGLVMVRRGAITLLPAGRLLLRQVAMVFDRYLNKPQQRRFSRVM
ncbi:oxygen-independent coproporphyrinogen-3 oxidase [Modicisalibacter ilicicola DSM 19980]|uniref:Coproporphyrinogen-III oxidase n=1 Tax=Modicisalibacter ilicicola DSM 19980 TaxID=1121942 RepID=A0A1M4WCH3_9GAMM|nr:oxygen-independent coproporphyrinogen III oxidase [Halomonas ilicicola]SHE78763.1 oxygen-independent coproporphyrinogen-3 oxidase [Halomonas ilicicola DSM 19980]